MKVNLRLSISLAVCCLLLNFSAAQGIGFFHGTWEEALIKAQEEEKLIFVDAYAVWCGPCKRMAKNVFTKEDVGEYYNAHFINIKMDMEKEPGRAFGQTYPVSAFPTLFYIDEKGEVLKKVVGGRQADGFLQLGEAIAGSYDRSEDLEVLYNDGDRSYDLVLKYIQALNNANKPSLKVANEFLRENPDISQEQKANFLFEALTASDSRIFDLFINDRDAIEDLKGNKLVAQKIEEACWNSIQTAMEFEARELVEEAKTKMKKTLGDKNKEFAYQADYEYSKAVADIDMLKASSLKIAKEIAKNDPERLHDLCNEIRQYKSIDQSVLATSEEIAKMAADKGKNAEYYFTYSKILAENNKKKKAAKSAEKALKKVDKNSKEAKVIQDWISTLKA
ncbi:MAG: thiol-disulfide isomerase/thioredoxin [Saprospiraceae bacterium]|jgi:thiol-disulfide isomerase/thioredoxin